MANLCTDGQKSVQVVVPKKSMKVDRGKDLTVGERTDAIYLILEDSSCSNEAAYLRVGWKPRVKDKNA